MNVGDIVIVHIERDVEGNQTIARWVQEVLAINPVGDVTHTCPVGTSAEAVPCEGNLLKSQYIVETEPMNKYEQEAVRFCWDLNKGLTNGPLDEGISNIYTITRLGLIKAIAIRMEEQSSP